MGLYDNVTIKDWLALHCTTKDVDELFRKALYVNDEPMAVLSLAELIRRGDNDLISEAIMNSIDAGYLKIGHFSIVLVNALANLASCYPTLAEIARVVH